MKLKKIIFVCFIFQNGKIGRKRISLIRLLSHILFHKSFRILFWYRVTKCCLGRKRILPFRLIGYFAWLMLQIVQRKSNVDFKVECKIGNGCLFIHCSGVVIATDAIIGDWCSIHQNVTIGRVFAGKKKGCPTIGNNVVIFPNSVIIGNCHVGDNVIIGAGAIVIDDIPDNCVVAGNPARILSKVSDNSIDQESKHFFYKE